MTDWQRRVIEEAHELSNNVQKLGSFIDRNPDFFACSVPEQSRLMLQRALMQGYLNVLRERIENFNK